MWIGDTVEENVISFEFQNSVIFQDKNLTIEIWAIQTSLITTMMRMKIGGLVTLWRKTCPDIEEEVPTTGSHKNLPINKQCNTWNDEGYDDEGDDEDGDARVLGNEYVTSSLPVPAWKVYIPAKRKTML